MKHLVQFIASLIGSLTFWGFVAVKLAGHTFAAWSWLWLFLPFVPWLSIAVQKLGL